MKKIRKLVLFFILVVLGFSISYASITTFATLLSVSGVDIIYANPGENCMNEVTISWHSSKASSKLIYTTADDKNYEKAKTIEVTGIYDETSFIYYDVCKFYKCRVDLKDLKANTEYIYKVQTDNIVSREHKFKTAGTGSFTFGYMSDIHAVNYDNLDLGMTAVKKLQTVQTLINKSTKESGKLDFMLTTGDEVWRGSQYSNWLEWSKNEYTTATEDYLWAGAPGNHEYYTQTTSSVWNYYPDKYASDPSKIYEDPDYFYNTYFNAIKGVPQNGPEGVNSCYWFLYGNVLFMCIDSMQSSEYAKLSIIKQWFKEVVKKNEGNYQYIVAYQHYPWYDFQTGVDKYAYRWNDIFDEFGVDLALSGHMHGYLRSKQLYNGAISDDEMKGTYYVVSPQIGDRPKAITAYNNVDLFGCWESTINYPDYSAMSTITVTKEGMTYKLLNVKGEVKDEFTIKAKRPYVLQNQIKEATFDSITLSSDSSSISAHMDPNNMQYVKNIQLIIDNEKVKSCNPDANKVSYVSVSGIDTNKIHDCVMNVTFIDGSKKTYQTKIATGDKANIINKLALESTGTKMKLSWEVSENASSYKVYVDDKEYASSSNNYAEIDLKDLKYNSKYSLACLDASGKIICMKDIYYTNYGDMNLDNKIDKNDASILVDLILKNKDFDETSIKFIDNNKDGRVDIGDAYKILSCANNTIDKIKEGTYLVTIVDESGNLLAFEEVSEGADLSITAPTIAGKTFKGYSNPYKNITSNIVLVAYYE